MKKSYLLLSIFLIIGIVSTFAAKVDTVLTFSPTMNKEIPAIVITPDSYNGETQLPVVYLLHGHSGNFSSWTSSSD